MSDPSHPHRPPRTRRVSVAILALAVLLTVPLGASYAASTGGGSGTADARGHRAAHPAGTARADLAQVRGAVARYHTTERAEAGGWGLVEGLDHCFEAPGVGGMGYHYIDVERLSDPTLDASRPEALVFVPGPRGQLRLGAVEYIVPVDAWEHEQPPSVLGHDLHQLEPVPGVHVWGLHVWLFEPNPDGMFADFNPRVTC